MSDLRKDPARGQWVLVRPPAPRAAVGEICPFCPGNEHLTPPEIAAYRGEGSGSNGTGWSVRVIPEADPYFRIESDLVREGLGMYDRISPRGATELIVESPRHDDTPASMAPAQWEQVLWMYRERLLDLKRDLAIRDILITRRFRKPGARISHPFSRLVAIPIIFDDVRRKLSECREYFQYKRRCLYCDILRQEASSGERVAHLSEHFMVLAPYAARAPFEAWVVPRQHGCAFEEGVSGEVVADLAAVLSGYFRALARVVPDAGFLMTLYTAPNRRAKVLPDEWSTIGEDYHWHIEVIPNPQRLTRVGGIYVNETPSESAALLLRDAWG